METPPTVGDSSPFQFVVPGLIAGIPIVLVLLAVLVQITGAAAWFPVIRRWQNRRLIASGGRRPPG